MARDPDPNSRRLAYGASRGELIRAAITVVSQRGIAGLSHRSVAAEANVTHGLVRHHFGSMTNLIAESLETILQQSLVVDPVALLLRDPPASDEELLGWIDQQVDLQVFEYEMLLATRHTPELDPIAQRLYAAYEASAAAAFTASGLPRPAPADITLIVAAIEGLVLHRVTFRRDDGAPIAAALAALRGAIGRAARGID